MLKLNGNRIAAIDFETTGLVPGFHEPIQIAVVPLGCHLRPLAGSPAFSSLIRPCFPDRADSGAMNVHGIPLSELLLAPEPADVAERLCEWVEALGLGAGKQLIPLAHPWSFEYGFCCAWLGRALTEHLFSRDARCTRSTAIALNDMAKWKGRKAKFKGVSLDALCKHFSIQNEHPHDALWDALCEAEVYRRLMDVG